MFIVQTHIVCITFMYRAFKAASSGSTSDLVEHNGLEFHASIDSGLQSGSCETDSPMFGKSLLKSSAFIRIT